MTYSEAKKIVGSAKPTFSTAIQLTDTYTNFSNIVIYESYNIKR